MSSQLRLIFWKKPAWNHRDTGDTRFVTVREVEVFRFHRFVTFFVRWSDFGPTWQIKPLKLAYLIAIFSFLKSIFRDCFCFMCFFTPISFHKTKNPKVPRKWNFPKENIYFNRWASFLKFRVSQIPTFLSPLKSGDFCSCRLGLP